MKHLKAILPFFLGMILILFTPNIFWALESQWPWDFVGENFEITKDAGDDFSPVIASNPNLHLTVWYRKTPSGFDIYGARITLDGEVLDQDGIPISTAPNNQMFPSISCDGENFFVVWQDKRSGTRWDIYGAMVTPEGQVLNPDGIPIAIGRSFYDQVSPSLIFDGENYFVVWRGKRTTKASNIYFKKVSRNGEILSDRQIPISPSIADQSAPAVAFNGQTFFIVWQDKRNGEFWDIYGARVAVWGKILDTQPIRITFSDEFGWDRWRPIVSWNGKYYLVIWMVTPEPNQGSLYGKRIGAEGEILDVVDIGFERGEYNKVTQAILWDGSDYFLIWGEEPEGNSRIFGTSIKADTQSINIGDEIQISASEANASFPALSMSGDKILVIWQGKDQDNYWQIYGQQFLKIPY